jgi:gluconate 2-dehydrogenase gamma chain
VSWYRNLTRREFIQMATAAAVLSGAPACTRSPWRFLKADEARTLAAMCDCLIPPDSDPGAEWARVVNFMDIQLCGPYRQLKDVYRQGIAKMDLVSRNRYSKQFAELVPDQQTNLLEAMEKGSVPRDIWSVPDCREFFEVVLAHTMLGFYGDSRHGGNRDHASWKMVGLEYPMVRGRFKAEKQI